MPLGNGKLYIALHIFINLHNRGGKAIWSSQNTVNLRNLVSLFWQYQYVTIGKYSNIVIYQYFNIQYNNVMLKQISCYDDILI